MKIGELEKAIRQIQDKITQTKLIPKCRDIAYKLGKGGSTSEEWCGARYLFSDEVISIDYEIYAMGDERLKVTSGDKVVFEAKEGITTSPEYFNPRIEINRRLFDILRYHPGNWEQRIEALHHKVTADVPPEQLAEVQKRFEIGQPE